MRNIQRAQAFPWIDLSFPVSAVAAAELPSTNFNKNRSCSGVAPSTIARRLGVPTVGWETFILVQKAACRTSRTAVIWCDHLLAGLWSFLCEAIWPSAKHQRP
jgi:hypothetical protein